MEKTPTAEEFLLKEVFPGHAKHGLCTKWMIEFAKIHVEAALKAAYENIEYTEVDSSVPYVVEDSILNSYPRENIK